MSAISKYHRIQLHVCWKQCYLLSCAEISAKVLKLSETSVNRLSTLAFWNEVENVL